METKHSILKIYVSSTDKIGSEMVYEFIVHKAKKENIAGVTVFRGIMGYGKSSKISSSRFWELTEKLPVTIEIIDETDKINAFFNMIEPELKKMEKGCIVTLEPVHILLSKQGKE